MLMALAIAFASPWTALAATSSKKKRRKHKHKTQTHLVQQSSGILEYPSDQHYVLLPNPDQTRLAYMAPATDPSSTWAGTVGAHIMSEKVISYMEQKYTAAESYALGGSVRNYVYFYGFDVTSQDVRGAIFYGIDQRQELELRAAMTSSLRGYMLGKGLMEYLKTVPMAAPYVSSIQKVERASQIRVEIKSSKPSNEEQNPWRISTGPDIPSRTFFAKAENGLWNFEVRDSFKLNEIRVLSGRNYYRSNYSLLYLNASNTLTPGYQYHIAKYWWAKWSSDFPLNGTDRSNRIFHTVGFRHLF